MPRVCSARGSKMRPVKSSEEPDSTLAKDRVSLRASETSAALTVRKLIQIFSPISHYGLSLFLPVLYCGWKLARVLLGLPLHIFIVNLSQTGF